MSPVANHHMIDSVLDGVRHHLGLIDHGMMHGLIKQLLKLRGVFRDCDMTWRGESHFLNDLPISGNQAE